METGRQALLVFYGIFWAAVVGVVARYHLFDTQQFFDGTVRSLAVHRFFVGLAMVDVVPMLWLWRLYYVQAFEASGPLPIVGAALSSLSVFGFLRIIHAVVASDQLWRFFYREGEWKLVLGEWSRTGPNGFWAHFLPGLGFLVIFPFIGYVVAQGNTLIARIRESAVRAKGRARRTTEAVIGHIRESLVRIRARARRTKAR